MLALVLSEVGRGFALPGFIALVLSPMLKDFALYVERGIPQLAGAMAIVLVMMEIFGDHRRS